MDTSSSNKSTETNFWEWLKRIAAPGGSLIGAILLVNQIVQLWRGDQGTLAWLTAGLGALLVLSGLIYVGFSKITHQGNIYTWPSSPNLTWKEPHFPKWQKIARWGLVFCSLAMIGIGVYFWQYGKVLDAKTIILLTQLDGPNPQNYRVTDIVYGALNDQFAGYDDTKIILLNETISEVDGREHAIKLGARYHADLVLWGWYGATSSDSRLTLHVENLSVSEDLLKVSEKMEIQVNVKMLDSFTLQQNLGDGLSGLILFISGVARYDASDYSGALERMSEAINTRDWLTGLIGLDLVYHYRGDIYQFSTQNEQGNAIADYTRAIQLNPKDTLAYFNRGAAYYTLGRYQQAIADYSTVIQLDPNNTDAYSNRGSAYANLSQSENALADYTRAVQLSPNDPIAYYNRGIAYSDSGQYEYAIDEYNKAIQLYQRANPGQNDSGYAGYVYILTSVYTNRGVAKKSLGKYEDAITDYNLAIQLDPNNYLVYFNRGNAYLLLDEAEQAVADESRAIELNQKYAPAYHSRGNSYFDLKQYEQAITDYNRAIQLDSKYSSAYYNLGNCFLLTSQYEQAIANYTKSVQLYPNQPDAYFNRGRAYHNLGKYEQAINDYNESIQLGLSNDLVNELYEDRGIAYYNLGQYEQAIAEFSLAIQLDPQIVSAYRRRGLAHSKLGQYEQAIVDYDKAISLDTSDAATYLNRAIDYYNLGQHEQARKDFQQALALCGVDRDLCKKAQEGLDILSGN